MVLPRRRSIATPDWIRSPASLIDLARNRQKTLDSRLKTCGNDGLRPCGRNGGDGIAGVTIRATVAGVAGGGGCRFHCGNGCRPWQTGPRRRELHKPRRLSIATPDWIRSPESLISPARNRLKTLDSGCHRSGRWGRHRRSGKSSVLRRELRRVKRVRKSLLNSCVEFLSNILK